MPKYQEVALTATQWTRPSRVVFDHKPDGTLTVDFFEERITQISDGRVINTPLTALRKSLTSAAEVIPLINQTTGLPTGTTATVGQLNTVLLSLYALMAEARDNLPPPDPEPAP